MFLIDELKADAFFFVSYKSGNRTLQEVLADTLARFDKVRLQTFCALRTSPELTGDQITSRFAASPDGDFLKNIGFNALAPAFGNAGSAAWDYHDQSRCLDLIAEHEQRRGAAYTRVIRSRMELEWVGPHPPLRLMSPDYAWIPSGEDWAGLNERHAVLARAAAEVYMRRWDMALDGRLAAALRAVGNVGTVSGMNAEMLLQRVLLAHGVRVARFPAVAALVCCVGRCWSGECHELWVDGALHRFKYPYEGWMAKVNAEAMRRGGYALERTEALALRAAA